MLCVFAVLREIIFSHGDTVGSHNTKHFVSSGSCLSWSGILCAFAAWREIIFLHTEARKGFSFHLQA